MSRCSEGRPDAVPLPAVSDPRMASSPGEMLVGNCDVITDGNIAGHDGWSAPEMVGSSSVIVRAGCAALPRCTDTTLVCVDEYTECDILDQSETFNGMPVYYGGDLYDSEDSDWDDPCEIASATYVEDYNFDFPEGMYLMVHERRRSPYGSCGAGPSCSTGGTLHGCHGIVASTQYAGDSWAPAVVVV